MRSAVSNIVEDAGASPRVGAFRSTDLGPCVVPWNLAPDMRIAESIRLRRVRGEAERLTFRRTRQNKASQRLPTRLTGPPRFIGVPARTPTPGAPTPGVTTARATGRARSTTPGLTMHPTG